MLCKSGSVFPATFEFAVWKQDRLPLVRVIDYAYQAPIDSIPGGPLFASPEREIKQEEESIVLTLVEESINLVYLQVPPFPHVEDYLWPDFSDDADTFFEQFEEQEELPSYRSESPRLPAVPRFNTPVDQRRIEFFQGWEFEEFDFRYVLPPAWQEPLPVSPRFPLVDLLDPGYHVPELEQVHQDFRNFYPEPIRSPSPLEEPIDWTYVHRRLLEQEIFRSGFSTPLTSSFIRSSNDSYRALLPDEIQDIIREGINLGIEQQGDRHHRSDSWERDVLKRRRISSELSPSSSTSFPSRSPSPPPIPLWHQGVPDHFGYQRPPLRRSEHLRKPARYR